MDIKPTGVTEVTNPQPSQPNIGHTTHGGDGVLPSTPLQEKKFPGHSDSIKEPVEVSHAEIPSTTEPPPTSLTQALPEGTATVSPPADPVSPEYEPSHRPRSFLDVCAGSTHPRSKALPVLHKTVLSIDSLLGSDMDRLNYAFYLQL